MVDIANSNGLETWLKDKPPDYACIIAARAAMRVAPVFDEALHEDAEVRRHIVVLQGFRALAAASVAGAWPKHAKEIRETARAAAREAGETVSDLAHGARMSVVEMTEAVPEAHEEIWDAEANARALGVAEHAVDAVVHAVQAAVDMIAAEKGIGSPNSVVEATVAVAIAACSAVDGLHGYSELLGQLEKDNEGEATVPGNIFEFWKAIERDAEYLEVGTGAGGSSEDLVADLAEEPLWIDGTPSLVGQKVGRLQG